MREGVEKAVEIVKKCLRGGECPLLHVCLPTGYGKSEMTFRVAELIAEIGEECSVERVIHVVPTKYLVEELVGRARRKGLPALAQSMFISPSLKAPYFIQPLVFTTLDSYVMNYYKVPVAELRSITAGLSLGHSEVPRYSILTALNVFDEYHIFAPGDSPSKDPKFESKAWTCLINVLTDLCRAKVPAILETATPRPMAFEKIVGYMGNRAKGIAIFEISFDYSARSKEGSRSILISDKEFASLALEKRFRTWVKEADLAEVAVEAVSKGDDFVLVVANTVKDAVAIYEKLRQRTGKCLLLHSRFTIGDRARKIREIESFMKRRRPLVLVSTQVVEVGVNLDFRVLVTSAAPISSLVQRIGRIGRGIFLKEKDFEIHIAYARVKDDLYDGIYSSRVVEMTIKALKTAINKHGEEGVSWKIPSSEEIMMDGRRMIPYNKLAEYAYEGIELELNDELTRILAYLTEPYVNSAEASRYMIRLGGFIRDSIILPAYVPPEGEEPRDGDTLELKPERLVPVKAELLGVVFHRASGRERIEVDLKKCSKVVWTEGDKIMAILSGRGDEMMYKLVTLSELANLLERMHAYIGGRLFSLEALVVRDDRYSPEVGLLIDD